MDGMSPTGCRATFAVNASSKLSRLRPSTTSRTAPPATRHAATIHCCKSVQRARTDSVLVITSSTTSNVTHIEPPRAVREAFTFWFADKVVYWPHLAAVLVVLLRSLQNRCPIQEE